MLDMIERLLLEADLEDQLPKLEVIVTNIISIMLTSKTQLEIIFILISKFSKTQTLTIDMEHTHIYILVIKLLLCNCHQPTCQN